MKFIKHIEVILWIWVAIGLAIILMEDTKVNTIAFIVWICVFLPITGAYIYNEILELRRLYKNYRENNQQ